MSQYIDPAAFAANTGFNVGSANSQDQFLGYGTAFMNPDQFKIDISPVISFYGAASTPFLSLLGMMRRSPTSQIRFSWMENELFTHRDAKMLLVRDSNNVYSLQGKHGGDWQIFEAAALADAINYDHSTDSAKPIIYAEISYGNVADVRFVPLAQGLAAGPTNYRWENANGDGEEMKNGLILVDYSDAATSYIGGIAEATLSDSAYLRHVYPLVNDGAGGASNTLSAANLAAIFTAAGVAGAGAVEVNVHVSTPNEQLKGFAQGSGLPNESRKRSRTLANVTQIFKTQWTISNTLKGAGLYGGPELGHLRLRKAIEHKNDIEQAMIFQGGGIEGADWGEIPSEGFENPLTRFKGLGVGVSNRNDAGFILTKNADLWPGAAGTNPFVLDAANSSMSALNYMTAAIFDDSVSNESGSKMVFCSRKWLMKLAEMALATNDSAAGYAGGQFVFGMHSQQSGKLGTTIKTITTPNGDLHFVPLPMLRGKWEDYAFVLDMEKIELKPFAGRDTTLHSNVGDQTIDGQQDYLLTELGFKVEHESCHAILKLA